MGDLSGRHTSEVWMGDRPGRHTRLTKKTKFIFFGLYSSVTGYNLGPLEMRVIRDGL
jgi:hypothetical protein